MNRLARPHRPARPRALPRCRFAGCGGSGKEDIGTPSPAPGQGQAEDKPDGDARREGDARARAIDTEQGGRRRQGRGQGRRGLARGRPAPITSSPSPTRSSIKDEPLEPSRSPRACGRSSPTSPCRRQPDDQGARSSWASSSTSSPRISKDGTVSCATCHNPEKGWTDNLTTSVGIDGQVGGRNAPTVLNTAYGRTMFWDGRAPSLEGQSQGPLQNKIEMGDQSYEEIIDRLRTIPGYVEQFKKVFGTDVTLDGMAKAIAAFERVAALSGNSAYDRYQDNETPDHIKELTESQKRGMVLFGLRLEQRRRVQGRRRCEEGELHALPRRRQLHRRAVPQPGRRLGRQAERASPTSAAGRRRRSARRTRPSWARSRPRPPRHRRGPPPTCTTAARRRSKRSSSTTTRAATPTRPRQGHEAAEADRPGEGRPRRTS